MATIDDIAKAAGVSHGTVSNVLNRTGKVSTEKIRLVEEAAHKLGYIPNVQASLLRQGEPTIIAIILPSLQELTCVHFYSAIQAAFHLDNYQIQLYVTNDIESHEEMILERLRSSGIKAVVTISTLSKHCCELYSSFPCTVLFIERKPQNMLPQFRFLGFDLTATTSVLWKKIQSNHWQHVALFTPPATNRFYNSIAYRLLAFAKDNQILLDHFTSDSALSLPKAFDLVQSGTEYDAIICFGTVRTASVTSALSLSNQTRQPVLVSLESSSAFFNSASQLCGLDYYHLGYLSAHFLTDLCKNRNVPRKDIILSPNGFLFSDFEYTRTANENISMLMLDNPSTNALKRLLPIFEKQSGIHIDIVSLPYDDLSKEIKKLDQNSGFDLIRMDVAEFDKTCTSRLLPLQDAGISADILPSSLFEGSFKRYVFIDHVPYALPFDPSVQIFLFRSDLFDDALLKRSFYEKYKTNLEVPQTVKEYLRIARFFTLAFNPDSPTKFGATLTCGSAATAASDFLPYYLSSDSLQQKGRNHLFDINRMVSALTDYKELANYSCQNQWWRESLQQFAEGTAATTVIYSNYASGVINSKHSNVVGKVGSAIPPGMNPLLGGGVIGISKYSRHIEACRKFFLWYYSRDIVSLFVRLGGTSPLINTELDCENLSLYPWLTTASESFQKGVRGTGNHSIHGFSIRGYENAVGSAVRQMIETDLSPEQTAELAQKIYSSQDQL